MQPVLLKLSGELFSSRNQTFNKNTIKTIVENIKTLTKTTNVGIVIGGGNFFKGNREGKELGLNTGTGHEVGMLATIMNGVIIQQLLEKEGVNTILFSALQCRQVAETINQNKINDALNKRKCLIFSGGTGNPFFTTDTNAVLRALQIDASEIWKVTNVDGIYSSDPNKNSNAKLIKNISYDKVISQSLGVMDLTAITLAKEYGVKIRILNMFHEDALIKAYKNKSFGSTIALAEST